MTLCVQRAFPEGPEPPSSAPLPRLTALSPAGFIIYFYYGIKKSTVGTGEDGDIEVHVLPSQMRQPAPAAADALSPSASQAAPTENLVSPGSQGGAYQQPPQPEAPQDSQVYVSPNPNNPFR